MTVDWVPVIAAPADSVGPVGPIGPAGPVGPHGGPPGPAGPPASVHVGESPPNTAETGQVLWVDTSVNPYLSEDGFPIRQTTDFDTAEIAAGGTWDTERDMAAGYRLLNVNTSHPARVRLYISGYHRSQDAARPIGTDPVTPHGVVLDLVTTEDTINGLWLAPAVFGYTEQGDTRSVAMAITNLTTAPVTMGITLTWIRSE